MNMTEITSAAIDAAATWKENFPEGIDLDVAKNDPKSEDRKRFVEFFLIYVVPVLGKMKQGFAAD
jgi:hypothetical protein